MCVLQSVSTCLVPGDTCNSTWRVVWHVLDRISPIYQIKSLPSFNTTTVQYDRTRSNSSNQWISVTADIPCCDNGTILTVTDFSGNKANCSVTRKSKAPSCTTTCRNGGKCKEGDSCACLGGYFGELCENGENLNNLNIGRTTGYSLASLLLGGCPNPPVPGNGSALALKTSYAFGDVIQWACNDRYEIMGDSATTCCRYGWTSTVPQCVEKGKKGFSGIHLGL